MTMEGGWMLEREGTGGERPEIAPDTAVDEGSREQRQQVHKT